MRFKILPKILLVLGFAAVILIIKYQSQIKDFFSFNLDKSKTYVDNFFFQSSPELKRRRPISLVQRETEVKLYVGEPFKAFSRKDWNWFWGLIYDGFPVGEPERKGLPKRMRQLTTDEIAFELMSRYPDPFAYFNQNNWQLFFEIVIKK